jgi:hypothetical protein
MKNRIINGAMVIDQRNGGASVTPSSPATTYTLDRWAFYVNQASKLTTQQLSATPPAGFSNYLGVTSSSAYSVVSSDLLFLYQVIEGYNIADLGWGTANAKTVTLSFQVRSSLTGTFGGVLAGGGGAWSYPFTYTISSANTWTPISVTIAGQTSGTWGSTNGTGAILRFNMGVGSTYLGTANTWANSDYYGATGETNIVSTNGATWQITGVQLEVGSSATGFEYVNYQTSLANCQRYYWQNTTANGYYAYQYNATNKFLFVPHPVTMRTTPTATVAYTSGSFTEYNTDIQQFKAYVSSSTADTTGYSTTSAKFSAEL